MKKRTIFLILIDVIIAVCFNLIFFINLENPIPQTWISYGFINFAFLMMVLSPFLTTKSKSNYLFAVVRTSVSLVYFVITIIISLVSIYVNEIPINLLLSLYIVLTAVFLVIFLSMLIIGEKDKEK